MNPLRPEDLYVPCPRCDGRGMVRYDQPSGVIDGVPTRGASWTDRCPECHGARGALTRSGEVVRDFVRTHCR